MDGEPSARSTPTPDLSLEIVQRIRAGDTGAWETLYLRYRDSLLLSIRCRLGAGLRSRLTSEDVLHSVVADALRDLERFEPRGPGSLNNFLHVCVLNKIRNKADWFGAQKRSGAVPLSDSLSERLPGSGDEGPRYLDDERFGRVERALAGLPEEMREVVLLRQLEGLPNTAVAERIGKSPEATSKIHNRALARLGVRLSEAPE